MKTSLLAPLFLAAVAVAIGERALFAAEKKRPERKAAPVKIFELKLYNKENFLSLHLHGDEVRVQSADRIEMIGMNLTAFSGDAQETPETILISPEATFFPKAKIARGDSPVRMLRDDIEITGEHWSYDDRQKKVSIQKNARVLFRAPLPDLLR